MAGVWCKGTDSVERDQYLDGKSRVESYNERETGMRMGSLRNGEGS